MLRWASAVFNVLGGLSNARGQEGLAVFEEQREFIARHAGRDQLKPGSWTRRIHELADQGVLTPEQARFCVRDYTNPSLDTTISATGHMIYQFGRNPDQWDLLRANPALAAKPAACAVLIGPVFR